MGRAGAKADRERDALRLEIVYVTTATRQRSR